MKIVYNDCYGSFVLSPKAIRRYAEIKATSRHAEIKGSPLYTPDRVIFVEERKEGDKVTQHLHNVFRNDPALVQVVEELGEEANGHHGTNLQIADVPPGERYRIDYDDGWERVMTIDDYYWSVAE